jgi:hypothetical protein
MTESEWLACDEPELMLEFLHGKGKPDTRKLRLLGCACCRRVWDSLLHGSRQAIETSELHADGLASTRRLAKAALKAIASAETRAWDGSLYMTERIYSAADAARAAALAACKDRELRGNLGQPFFAMVRRGAKQIMKEIAIQCTIIRCVYGNPFHTVMAASSWLTPTVTALAQAIYTDRAFDRVPFLADALEDAGCSNADILEHCRQPGEHCRGCWVVDVVLGRE